jgi:tRNA(Leu) C34 or U34 (ribose-2'-O)-methylase TrmL
MDYWKELEVIEHKNWETFVDSKERPSRVHLLTTHAEKTLWEHKFPKGGWFAIRK